MYQMCARCIQSEVIEWRLLFIFTASAHLISAVCFVLLWLSRYQPPANSTAVAVADPRHSVSPASPTDKPVVVRQTSSGRSSGRPSGGSLHSGRESHLVQLMESSLYEGKGGVDVARSCMQCTRDVLLIGIRLNALAGQT